MHRIIISLAAIGGIALGGGWLATAPGSVSQDALAGLSGDPLAGEAVFWAAGCASCHAASGAQGNARLVLEGGQRFASDFGTFVAPNISMHPEQGIGGWTERQFITALQHGSSPDGQHYYPAFPYTAYSLAETQDLVDLWAFWQTLPSADMASQPHDLGFPFSIRRAVGVWNILNLQDYFTITGDFTETQARGRYLAEALSHCAECHTPRDALGGLDRTRWMAGAPNPSGSGTIPALTPDKLTWSEAEIAAYLNDGFTPDFDSAGGSMVSVIANLAMLSEADRLALAAYLKALPPGCKFQTRCPVAIDRCRVEGLVLESAEAEHNVACHRWK